MPKCTAFPENITSKILPDNHSHHPCSFYELSVITHFVLHRRKSAGLEQQALNTNNTKQALE